MSLTTNEFDQPLGHLVHGWTPPAFPAPLEMQGSYCTVEPFDPDAHGSAPVRRFIRKSNLTGRTCHMAPLATSLHSEDWIQTTCLGDDPQFYTLLENETGNPGGVASYLRITPKSSTIEVGHIHLGPALKRSRAATEAMYLMMDYVFSLGYRRYEWKCNALNQLSRNAALRLGFTFEGIWRQATVSKGRNRDTSWYSIVDADWPRIRTGFKRWLDASNFDSSGSPTSPIARLYVVSVVVAKRGTHKSDLNLCPASGFLRTTYSDGARPPIFKFQRCQIVKGSAHH